VVIALAGGVCAQQTLSVFDCSGIPALLAERHGPVCNQAGTLKGARGLTRSARAALRGEGAAAERFVRATVGTVRC